MIEAFCQNGNSMSFTISKIKKYAKMLHTLILDESHVILSPFNFV